MEDLFEPVLGAPCRFAGPSGLPAAPAIARHQQPLPLSGSSHHRLACQSTCSPSPRPSSPHSRGCSPALSPHLHLPPHPLRGPTIDASSSSVLLLHVHGASVPRSSHTPHAPASLHCLEFRMVFRKNDTVSPPSTCQSHTPAGHHTSPGAPEDRIRHTPMVHRVHRHLLFEFHHHHCFSGGETPPQTKQSDGLDQFLCALPPNHVQLEELEGVDHHSILVPESAASTGQAAVSPSPGAKGATDRKLPEVPEQLDQPSGQ